MEIERAKNDFEIQKGQKKLQSMKIVKMNNALTLEREKEQN